MALWLLTLICVAVLAAVIAAPLDLNAQGLFGAVAIMAGLTLDRFGSRRVTVIVCILSVVASTRYLYWRTTQTLHFHTGIEGLLGAGLYLAELYAWLILVLGYLQTICPLDRGVRSAEGPPESWPTVDVYITTYNESLEIVQDTVLAALSMDYPRERFRVFMLDDGRRPEFRAFAEKAGCSYITRPDNFQAKAGNLNNALAQTSGELICVFDCDHIPTRAFLQMTVGWFQQESRLALLQTPHHFYSPDPLQRNLVTVKDVPEEEALFYGVVQPGNDLWNAAFFCGSCALIRRSALEQIHGFAGETVTEDAHTALKLQRLGWSSAYLNVRLASGLATERLALHIGQRARWARGMTQILRLDNPLFGPGLSLAQRLCYFNAALHFLFPLPRVVFLTSPLAFLLFGQNVIEASAPMILVYAVPHLAHSILANNRVQGRYRRAFWGEVLETVLAFHLLFPTLTTLIDPRRGKFNVTAKGGLVERAFFDLRLMWPHVLASVLLVAGLATGFLRLWLPHDDVEAPTVLLNALWSAFSLLLLLTALAVGRETEQQRKHVRVGVRLKVLLAFDGGRVVEAETNEASMGGFSVSTTEHGALQDVGVQCNGRWIAFAARKVAADGRLLRVQFLPMSIARRRELVCAIMGRADAWQPDAKPPTANPLASLLDLIRASLSILVWRRPSRDSYAAPYSPTALRPLRHAGLLVLSLLAGGSMVLPTRLHAQPLPAPAAADMVGERQVSLTLADLGVRTALRLTGVGGEAGVPLPIRRDEVVTRARLTLSLAYSPALLADLSRLTVLINDESVATLPLDPSRANGERVDIDLEPALFVTDNRLDLRFQGHSTRSCEDPSQAALWARVSNTGSVLQLTLQRLPARPDLARLPQPFFDPGGRKLELPFLFAGEPADPELQAAAAVSSYFGMRASYRGFRFPVLTALPPSGDAVVFATSQDRLPGLQLPQVRAPTVAMAANPNDPTGHLLLVLGRSPEEVRQAAYALGVGITGLTGQLAEVRPPSIPARRPYDAPRWVRTDRPVRLGELADATGLQAVGTPPPPVDAAFRLAPDLFLWPRTFAPLRLRYRHPMAPWIDGEASRLDVSLNGQYLQSYRLADESLADMGQVFRPSAQNQHELELPAYRLYGQNQLQVYYELRPHKTLACHGLQLTNVSIGVDPDSTLDLTGARHFARLPDLAYFASAGFPFTRMADLAETAVVLPVHPSPAELESFLTLAGRFGDATGAPVTGLSIVRGPDDDVLVGRDVLALGGLDLLDAHPRLFAGAPFGRWSHGWTPDLPPYVERAFAWFGMPVGERPSGPAAEALATGKDFAGFASFRSPIDPKRTVVALLADQPDRLPGLVDRLGDAREIARVQGDVAIDADGRFASYRIGPSYWSGGLPAWLRAMWWLNRNPLALAAMLLAAAAVLATPVHLALRAQARRRLRGADH
jgi:cellulose synthase (UDP-forming)